MPPVEMGNVGEVLLCLWVRKEEMKTRRALASLRESSSSKWVIWDFPSFHLQAWKFLPLAITMSAIFKRV